MAISQNLKLILRAQKRAGFSGDELIVGKTLVFGDDQNIIAATISGITHSRGAQSPIQIYFSPMRFHGLLVDRLTLDKDGHWYALPIDPGEELLIGELEIL